MIGEIAGGIVLGGLLLILLIGLFNQLNSDQKIIKINSDQLKQLFDYGETRSGNYKIIMKY